MNTITLNCYTNAPFGKRLLDDLYIHIDYLKLLLNDPSYGQLVQAALDSMSQDNLNLCNVAKINLNRHRLSFLQYLNFDQDPFPTLNGSWVFDPIKLDFSHRSYSNSLNPPILHRKELLVPHHHPQRAQWQGVTNSAEALGLFSSGKPIGFKLNWLRLISDKSLLSASQLKLGHSDQ